MKVGPLVVGLVLLWAMEARAQFIRPPFAGPVIVPANGIGFSYRGRNLRVGGFFSTGYPGAVLLNPYRYYPGPAFFGTPFGFSSTNITVNVITPPTIVVNMSPFGRLPEAYDLRGVDLDVNPPPRVPEVGRAPPPLRAEPAPIRPAPFPPVRPAEMAKPQPPAAKPPPPIVPPPLVEVPDFVQLGLDAAREQEYGLAARHFQKALEAEPFNERGAFFLAQAYFALGRFRDAVRTIETGITRRPGWPDRPFRPRLDFYQGHEADLDEHLQRLRDTQTRQPKNADFLFLLAHQFWFDGRRMEAAVLFQRARPLAADPFFCDVFLGAGKPGVVAVR